MKFWVLLLLCIAVPLQGMASVRASRNPCTMDAGLSHPSASGVRMLLHTPDAQATMAEDQASDPAADDCCNDAEAAAKSGQPCKTGQECSASACSLVGAAPAAAVFRAPSVCPDSPDVVGRSGPMTTVWRPPSPR